MHLEMVGIIWFYSHVFKLDPGPTITWNIKMVYGLIFDNFPIFKKHDKPYMILSVVISTLGFLGLRFEFFSDTPASTALCFWLALMGMAMSDVIADSMVVKQARDAGLDGGANLQTFCWIMSSVGSIIGRPVAGILNGEDGNNFLISVSNIYISVHYKGSGSRALLGGLYTFTGIINLVASFFFQEMKGDVTWSMSRVNEQIIKLLRAILLNKTVLVPMLWIILSAAAVPDVSSAMNFWKKDILDIGATQQAYIDTTGDFCSILGLLIYSGFFKQTPYRKIFFVSQLLASIFVFSDVVLIYRWNLKMYIPDTVFLVGSQTIINTIYSLQNMPFLVMAAQLCPKEIEATFYATMMSLSNTGGSLSAFWGGHLMNALHIVKLPVDNNNTSALLMEEEYDFSQLPTALWIRVVGMIIPAFLALIMLPNTNVMEAYEEKNNAEFVELRNILFSEDLDNDSTLFGVKTSLEIIDEFDEIPLLSCKRQAF
ncbi:hypothetical protein HDU92_008211 [Lobulomyces angularis]|nr:hypothetical protein HDU92_008211 [Lobulomyces angularis]